MSGLLWARQQKGSLGSWRRRYVILNANFIYVFSDDQCDRPTKPLATLCFEDMTVERLDPPKDKALAGIAQFGFVVAPRVETKRSAARITFFCAESAADRQAWEQVLQEGRFSKCRADLTEMGGLYNVLMEALSEAQRTTRASDAARAEAEGSIAAAEEKAAAAEEASKGLRAEVAALKAEVAQARARAARARRTAPPRAHLTSAPCLPVRSSSGR
jgi:hypothetical protein